MRVKTRGWLAAVVMMALGSLAPAWAQTPTPAPAQAPAEEKKAEEVKPDEKKPKTLWDEFKLFSYVEMGATFNFHGGSMVCRARRPRPRPTYCANTTSTRGTRSTSLSSASSATRTRRSPSGMGSC